VTQIERRSAGTGLPVDVGYSVLGCPVTRRSIVIRLVEGQRVMGWREALNELDLAYPGRLR
jgi:hypothetical protein